MTYEEFNNIIKERFPEVTEGQMEQFRLMEGLYREWNAKINVVSRKDIDELYRHHVLHSLAIAAYIKANMPHVYEHLRGEGAYSIAAPLKIMDLGTGGEEDGRGQDGFDGFFDSVEVSLSKLQDMVKDSEVWYDSVHGVIKSRTWLSH